jgi:hypothetical protein
MKVIVTSGYDFIGSHLIELLVLPGHKSPAFVFYNSFSSWIDHCDEYLKDKGGICWIWLVVSKGK